MASLILVATLALALPAHIALEHGHLHLHWGSASHHHDDGEHHGHGHDHDAAEDHLSGDALALKAHSPSCCGCQQHDGHSHCVKEHLTGQTRKQGLDAFFLGALPAAARVPLAEGGTGGGETYETPPCQHPALLLPALRAPPAC